MAETAAERAYKLAKEYESNYKGCSGCVIAALQDVFNIRNDDIFKASTGLSAGGGWSTDGSCGAYAGAILILGFLTGRERSNIEDSEGIRFRTHGLVRKLHDRFIQEYGAVICRDIQAKVLGRPYYIIDPDEFNKFSAVHDIHCVEVIGKSAQWTAELILEENLIPHIV